MNDYNEYYDDYNEYYYDDEDDDDRRKLLFLPTLQDMQAAAEESVTLRRESRSDRAEYIHKTELHSTAGIMIPDALWVGKYADMSLEAKVTYGAMRRRAYSSDQQGYDEDGCLYVKMTIEEVKKLTGKRSKTSVRKIFAELEKYDLIEAEEQETVCKVRRIFLKHMIREDGTAVASNKKEDTDAANRYRHDYKKRTRKVARQEAEEIKRRRLGA